MATAVVGDDVFGDDPSVIALEERVAALFEREAAIYCPTGTMANQIAIGLGVSPGDEILMEERSHTFHFEVGGAARLWGAQPRLYPSAQGIPDPAAVAALVRPDNVHLPRTRLCLVENTHNVWGGRVVPIDVIGSLRRALPETVRLHLDGARLWHAHVATGTPLAAYGAVAQTLMVALSKGLGCPAGSLVVGDKCDIAHARRLRKLLGGGMRQVGVLAATGMVALDEGFERLRDDHARARRIAEAYGLDPQTVDTNIVIIEVGDATAAVARLEEAGVRTVPITASAIRFVTHRDIHDRDVERACQAAATLLGHA